MLNRYHLLIQIFKNIMDIEKIPDVFNLFIAFPPYSPCPSSNFTPPCSTCISRCIEWINRFIRAFQLLHFNVRQSLKNDWMPHNSRHIYMNLSMYLNFKYSSVSYPLKGGDLTESEIYKSSSVFRWILSLSIIW